VGPSSRDEAHCAVIRKLARIIETAEPVLRTAEPSRDVWCGYYLPYEPAAFTGDLPGARELVQEVFTAGDMGLTATSSVQTLMALAGVTQGSLDLGTATAAELAQARQLWALSLDFMAEPVQRKLLEYARRGGHLVVLPGLPRTDDRPGLHPATRHGRGR
jgi:beta-galactosidase GanA